jgi:hypothetical protein
MKKITITAALLVFAVIACKKNSEHCDWFGMKGSRLVYVWQNSEPSKEQIQKVQDTCFCILVLEKHCGRCKTDSAGNVFDCN